MISPPFLQRGDKVGVVATARRVTEEQMRPAISILQGWGVQVVLSPQLFQEGHSYLAGKDENRIAGLQQFLDDPNTSAIICARGGYGTTRIHIWKMTFTIDCQIGLLNSIFTSG